jgi:hypothetical protein
VFLALGVVAVGDDLTVVADGGCVVDSHPDRTRYRAVADYALARSLMTSISVRRFGTDPVSFMLSTDFALAPLTLDVSV